MAWAGKDSREHRAWRAAFLLGLALVAGAFALALLYPFVAGPGYPAGIGTASEDALALLALLAAVRLARGARWVAGLLLGVAIASRPWKARARTTPSRATTTVISTTVMAACPARPRSRAVIAGSPSPTGWVPPG
jgi:hypothetical protein